MLIFVSANVGNTEKQLHIIPCVFVDHHYAFLQTFYCIFCWTVMLSDIIFCSPQLNFNVDIIIFCMHFENYTKRANCKQNSSEGKSSLLKRRKRASNQHAFGSINAELSTNRANEMILFGFVHSSYRVWIIVWKCSYKVGFCSHCQHLHRHRHLHSLQRHDDNNNSGHDKIIQLYWMSAHQFSPTVFSNIYVLLRKFNIIYPWRSKTLRSVVFEILYTLLGCSNHTHTKDFLSI